MVELERIKTVLANAVRNAVLKSPPTEPVYSIVVQYYGSDSDGDLTPSSRMPSETRRQALLTEKGSTAPHHIWVHDEFDDDHAVFDLDLDDQTLRQLWADLNRQMEAVGLT